MTRHERVYAALRGEPVDRVPIALWRHFPEEDQTAQGLAQAVLAFQERFDFDFVKGTPTSGYPVEDWGARFVYRGNDEGTRDYVERPVKSHEDWRALQPLDVTQGVLGRELEALRLIGAQIGGQVPFIQTIFSPLTTAKNMAGQERFLHYLRQHPDDLHAALAVIAQTTAAFARASLEAGADGLFFATQLASRQVLREDEYREFGETYDRQVLDAVAGQTDFLLLHIHGQDVMFNLLARYPVQAINWHDRRTSPSLAEAQERFGGCVVGGINEWGTLLQGTPDEVVAEVGEAIAQTGGQRHIVGAGCVTPITAPEANIQAARQAVEKST